MCGHRSQWRQSVPGQVAFRSVNQCTSVRTFVSTLVCNPNVDLTHSTICQNDSKGWRRPFISLSPWKYPHSPAVSPFEPGIIRRSALCVYQLFVRDLPPQSHKSTEDRCLLCLIKALPPGVIPQFEQEEKPSKGGGCSGSIPWRAHIIHSSLTEKNTQHHC